MLDLSSSSLSFTSRSFRPCAGVKSRESTTEPVSGGKSSASANAARQRTRAARKHACLFTAPPSELHLRRCFRTGSCGEFRHPLFTGESRFCPDDCRESSQRRVKGTHRVDVTAPRGRYAILSVFELRLQSEEVSIGFEVGISFGDCQQPTERARQLRLGLLKSLDLVRVSEVGGVDFNLGRLGTCFYYGGKHVLFLRRIALNSGYQVWNQISAALI